MASAPHREPQAGVGGRTEGILGRRERWPSPGKSVNQLVSPENTHTSNIIWTQQVIFGNIYVCENTYSYEITIDKEETVNLKRSGYGYREGFGRRKT